MNRRELLKAILPVASVPIVFAGAVVGKAFKVEPNAKYTVFIDESSGIDIKTFCSHSNLPTGTPVYIYNSCAGDDPVKIFKLT